LKDETDATPYNGELKFDAQQQLTAVKVDKAPKAADPWLCPKCKQGQMLKGKAAYGCSRFREGCQFVVPFAIGGKTLPEKQVQSLIQKGKTTKIKGFVSSKTGNAFEAALILNPEFKIVFQFD